MTVFARAFGLTVLFVGACTTPLDTYYRPGATVQKVERETIACEVSALRQVPASTQTRRLPPRFVPPQQFCDSAGACTVRPGYYIPGEVVSFDPNDGLRQRVEQQCMADRGYAPVSIPECPESIAAAAPYRAQKTLPKLNAQSCVIYQQDGTFQIVTRG